MPTFCLKKYQSIITLLVAAVTFVLVLLLFVPSFFILNSSFSPTPARAESKPPLTFFAASTFLHSRGIPIDPTGKRGNNSLYPAVGYPQGYHDVDFMERYLKTLSEANIKTISTQIWEAWFYVTPDTLLPNTWWERGYVWDSFDLFLDIARKYGVNVHAWIMSVDSKIFWPDSDYQNHFVNVFLPRFVDKFGDRVFSYSFFDEYNVYMTEPGDTDYNQHPSDASKMVSVMSRIYPVIHSRYPAAKITYGGVALGDVGFLEKMYELGVANYVNQGNYHVGGDLSTYPHGEEGEFAVYRDGGYLPDYSHQFSGDFSGVYAGVDAFKTNIVNLQSSYGISGLTSEGAVYTEDPDTLVKAYISAVETGWTQFALWTWDLGEVYKLKGEEWAHPDIIGHDIPTAIRIDPETTEISLTNYARTLRTLASLLHDYNTLTVPDKLRISNYDRGTTFLFKRERVSDEIIAIVWNNTGPVNTEFVIDDIGYNSVYSVSLTDHTDLQAIDATVENNRVVFNVVINESPSIIRILYKPPTPLPGDANGDGRIDGTDLELLKQDYLGQPVHNTDFNSDGRVDCEDFAILQANYSP